MTEKNQDKGMDEEIKNLVIARLETLSKNSKIILMGFKKPLTVENMMDEIRNNSDLGKKIVEVQFKFIQQLSRGEI